MIITRYILHTNEKEAVEMITDHRFEEFPKSPVEAEMKFREVLEHNPDLKLFEVIISARKVS